MAYGTGGTGLCECGCGQETQISKYTDKRRGMLKGQPLRFVRNHHQRKSVRWIEQDCGYETPCWIWQLCKVGGGYGQVHLRIDGEKVCLMAHRWSWEVHVGPIAPGAVIDHQCQRRDCVNPDHLQEVTTRRNNELVKERRLPVCSHCGGTGVESQPALELVA